MLTQYSLITCIYSFEKVCLNHRFLHSSFRRLFLQGTGKMPAYTLLVNEANMSMDELQAFINALCYSHQIINSAISLPEPIYQADEWAKRGRNNFRAM